MPTTPILGITSGSPGSYTKRRQRNAHQHHSRWRNNQIAGCGPDLRGIYYQNASEPSMRWSLETRSFRGLTGCQSGEGSLCKVAIRAAGERAHREQHRALIPEERNHGRRTGRSGRLQYNYISAWAPQTARRERYSDQRWSPGNRNGKRGDK